MKSFREHNEDIIDQICEDCDLYDDLVITEAEYQGKKVKLNDPFRLPSGSNSKFGVYVKNEKGNVECLDKQGCDLKLPHIGWNNIKILNKNLLTENLVDDSNFYFVNSYSFKLINSNEIIASTTYGIEFPSIINKKNVFGTQFHPEKSSKAGIQILKNFINA